jgi:hypothetical protein
MREIGIRPTGGIRIDSSTGVEAWDKDPKAARGRSPRPSRKRPRSPRTTASSSSPRRDLLGRHAFLARDGEAAGDGRRPGVVGYQADMAHSMLYTLGYNREQDRLLPKDYDWQDRSELDTATKGGGRAAPWTLDFHVAQNDGTVFGSGDHEKTGRHCQVTDPNGKLDWSSTPAIGCATETATSPKRCANLLGRLHVPQRRHGEQETWNDVLGAMVKVREAHGWRE